MSNVVRVKKGEDRRKAMRMQMVASRMVGMYRLLNEEMATSIPEVSRKTIVGDYEPYRKDWMLFKAYLEHQVYKSILSPESMGEIIDNSWNQTGSLGDLLFDNRVFFPKQSVSIRFGIAMEHAIKDFLNHKEKDAEVLFRGALTDFCGGKEVQIDVANMIGKNLIYAELKYNMQLDTEKIEKVVEKIDTIRVFFKKEYKHSKINPSAYLVSLRYPTADQIVDLKPGLEAIRDQYLIGYQEFFALFDFRVTEKMWTNLHADYEQKIYAAYDTATKLVE